MKEAAQRKCKPPPRSEEAKIIEGTGKGRTAKVELEQHLPESGTIGHRVAVEATLFDAIVSLFQPVPIRSVVWHLDGE